MPPAEATETTHSRKKIRRTKLCQISNTILSILAAPKTTQHQDGLGRRE